MHKVMRRLIEEYNYPLDKADALELFAREGDWHTVAYAPYVKSLEAWEINPAFNEGLKKNLPNAKIKITDTYKEIQKTTKTYDLIVIDNANSTYGENNEHCEHLGLLPSVFRISNDECVIILNVNMAPYNLHKNPVWWNKRKEYYKTDHPDKLDPLLVAKRYNEICMENNIKLQRYFFQQRETSFMYYFIMQIRR